MVDSEPTRPLTLEVTDDVSTGFGVPGDNRQHTQDQTTFREGRYHRDDHEYRSRRGGDRGAREGNGEGDMSQMEDDDPHGNAAMTLTALSFGVMDHKRTSSRSGLQGFIGRQQSTSERDIDTQSERGGRNMTPSYSERPLREAQEAFTDATKSGAEGSRQQQQCQQTKMPSLALHLPLSVVMTPSSSSSALNTSTLTASESTSPISAQEDVAPRDALVTAQEQYTPHAPGERIQSLSHMLKDRLSLASFRTEGGWDKVDMDVSEKRALKEDSRQLTRRNDHQQYHDYHDRTSTSLQEFSLRSSRPMTERPGTPPISSKDPRQGHAESEEMRRQQWIFSHDNQSQQHQQSFQLRPQLQEQQQQQQQQNHRIQSSSSIRDDRNPSQWMAQNSPLPIVDPTAIKPKRKYTKKSTLHSHAIVESRDHVDFQSKQERNELLYSDRGLILKTQIPKKGRPISKHSTTSSQSTPTLTSLGIFPASQHYFTKAGTSSLSPSAVSGLFAAPDRYSSSDPALTTQSSSSPQGAHPPLMPDQHGSGISPTNRRPGRPPSKPTLTHHTHSQSHSNVPSIPFPPSQSGQGRHLPSPTAHEFDFHSAQHKNNRQSHNQQELDDNRFSAYRDRSPTLSVATTTSQPQSAFPQGHHPDYWTPSSNHQYVSSPIEQEFSGDELDYRKDENDPSHPGRRHRTVNAPSALPPRSFAEGIPAQMNTLKRSSSGMQKSLSMDGYHSRPMENRRRRRSVGGINVGGGGGGSGSMGYGTDGQFEGVNEEVGSNFSDEEFDDSADDARSRKRVSGSDLDYSGVDRVAVSGGGTGSVRRRVNQQGGNKTWHGTTIGSERRRPRSLVLPRGFGEPALPWTTVLDPRLGSGLESRSGTGSGSVVKVQRHLDRDDDEIDYREMMIMTPAIASDPPQSPPDAAPSSLSSSSMMMRGVGTSGKGRGRSMRSHVRSLDISFSARGHHGHHRPLSPSSFEHPSQHGIHSSEEMLPEQQRTLSSSRRVYSSSSSSLNSPPFGDTLSAGIDQAVFNLDTTRVSSITDKRGYSHDTRTVTRTDILAREMSAMHSIPSPSTAGHTTGGGRGRRGLLHGHHHLKAAVVKRSTTKPSKRGPGPHLKKHQILQQQLYQMQRDQEEMDLQMAMQLQQRQMQMQRQQQLERQQQQQEEKKQQQQRRPTPHPQRHQHSQSLQLEHEFTAHEFHQQSQQQQQPHQLRQPQQQPQPGRPTKQRVLLRSESALAVLHGLHSPPLGSSSSQSQLQPSPLQSSTISAPTSTPVQPTSSRRRQNQQQPILLRPVSLPSFTGGSGSGGGGSSGGGAGGIDSESSPPYLMNHPPPGQPLFRSLHAPYLVSPTSLVSVDSNASSSTTLATLGRRIGVGERGEEGEDGGGDGDGSRGASPVKSPQILCSTTPPLTTAESRMFTPPSSQGYPPHPQRHRYHQQQGHSNHRHHHPYQRPSHHQYYNNTSADRSITSFHQDNGDTISKHSSHPLGTMSRSSSSSRGDGGMSTSSSTTTLVHSSTSQSSLHQYHHRRHSSSLPSLNSYYQSSTTSSSSTSPQHPIDLHQKQQQQQRAPNTHDPTRPPIHRMVSHDALRQPLKHTSSSSSSSATAPPPHLPTSGTRQSPYPQQQHPSSTTAVATTTTTMGDEASVERLLIRTPLGDV